MKVTQILALTTLAQAQLDMDAFMRALMSKDPRQVESFKQRLMNTVPKKKEPKKVAQKKVEPEKKVSKVEDQRNRFANYRNQRPTFKSPAWSQKKDKKVIDLTKPKTTKAPKVKTTKSVRTTRRPKTTTESPRVHMPTLNRKINSHVKHPSPLSAGGRLFGYQSIVHDFNLPEVKDTPFKSGNMRMAMSSKEVFGRGSFGRSGGKTNSCFSCQGDTYENCLAAGQTENCMADETACFVREYTQSNGVAAVVMGCQNVFQCVDDFNANAPLRQQGFDNMPDVAGLTSLRGYDTADQCRPGEPGSVCHQCCTQGDNCNQAWVNSQLDSIDEWINFDV